MKFTDRPHGFPDEVTLMAVPVVDPIRFLADILFDLVKDGECGRKYDHPCQWCGYGHIERYSEESEHEPGCAYDRARTVLRLMGRDIP